MKRANHLFERITEYSNVSLAFLKALRGKRSSNEAIRFCRNSAANLDAVRRRLAAVPRDWGPYRQFTITDPKPRIISAVPFEDRVMHHAVMNILEPFFERRMIHHTYACTARAQRRFGKAQGAFFIRLKYPQRLQNRGLLRHMPAPGGHK